MTEITITVTDETTRRLAVLISPAEGLTDLARVLERLADHAQQAIYRPGSWERAWLIQAFGDAWLDRLEPDISPGMLSADGRVIFDRPKRGEEGGGDA